MLRLISVLLLGWGVSVLAADPMIPGTRYQDTIPDYQSVLGYEPGERISSHANIVRFFNALQEAQPQRLKVQPYAASWEGRELFYAIIGSPENLARLDQVKQDIQALADPRETDQAAADALIDKLPGVAWLSYSVHGNEISPADAAMMLAYHLLAAESDPVVDNILQNAIVIIDPLQNPDGRDRFVHRFESSVGLQPQADRLAAEHDEPWPSGRVNHYLFDLNRDWLAVTQPETAGRVKALLEWYPLAFVDAHEMGSDSTYFFAPEAIPYNPHLADSQRAALPIFGRNNARWFDRFGIDYFTREIFDAFYPGYGASWPAYHGAIAMTYEQASSRGLLMRRLDGSEFSYRETVRHHFLTTLATAETVATHRERLLKDFYQYQVSAIREGSSGSIRSYLIPTQADQAGADKLAGLLSLQGVEVQRAQESFSACGTDYRAGSYVVNLNQPAKRLIRTLLDEQVDMDPQFLKEQERRRSKDLPDQIYDVTAWSLPLMFNLEANSCNRTVSVSGETVDERRIIPGSVDNSANTYAYIAKGGSRATLRLMTAALKRGLKVKSNEKPFTLDDQEYPSGSLIFKSSDNADGLPGVLSELAGSTGAQLTAVTNSWVTKGPSFGSQRTVDLIAPRIAMAWDQPTIMYSAGATRFVIERQFGYPVTPIRTFRLASADLSHYDVLILPEQGWGSYQQVLGESGGQNLARWVRNGGILVLLGSAMEYATLPDIQLLTTHPESEATDEEPNGSKQAGDNEQHQVPGTRLADEQGYLDLVEPEQTDPDSVSGILAKAIVDTDHWMSAGVAEELNVLVRGSSIYQPLKLNAGANVASFASADDLLVSGYLWDQNRQQLAYKPFVVSEPTGRGYVIGFTQDPTVRAYLDGLNAILLNALFRAPAYASGQR